MTFDKVPLEPIHSIFNLEGTGPNLSVPGDNPFERIKAVDLLFIVEYGSGRETLLYGLDALNRIEETGQEEELTVMRIGVDEGTGEIQRLITLVERLRGSTDLIE